MKKEDNEKIKEWARRASFEENKSVHASDIINRLIEIEMTEQKLFSAENGQ